MLAAPRIRVTAPLAARAEYLTRAYADLSTDRDALKATLAALIPLQGHAQVEHWQMLADKGALQQLAAELMEQHYDPRYGKSRGRNDPTIIAEIAADTLSPAALPDLAKRIAIHLAKA